MSRRRPRRLLVSLTAATLLLVSTGVDSVGANPASPTADPTLTASQLNAADRVSATKAPTSKLAQSDPALLARTDNATVTAVVKLDYDSTATFEGGQGYEATSPAVTGQELTGETAAEVAYEQLQVSKEQAFATRLAQAVPGASVGSSLRTVYGGVEVTLPARAAKTVAQLPGVVAVQADVVHKIQTDSSPQFIGAPTIWANTGGQATSGAGVIYGNLDTGIWPEHPSFTERTDLPARPTRPDGTTIECDFGDNPLTPAADVYACNNKLIGGYPFLDTYLSNPDRAAAEPFHTARDSNGHGTHTSSTAGGNIVEDADILGRDRGPITGLAPGVHVIEYKVCGIQGCFSTDSAAAVQQAILDGVDVINFSISGGTQPLTDPVELAFLDAYAAGVFVAASAGNEGPGASTANHLSPWVTSVGASTNDRKWQSTITLAGGGGATLELTGTAIRPDGAGPLPVVLASAAPYNNELCTAPAPAGLFDGKIVACKRGPNRVLKGFNVLQGGAEGMILYNAAGDLFPEMSDTHWLPTVHTEQGAPMLSFLAANPGATATFTAGEPTPGFGSEMSAFSSRGPAGPFIKPDITAPGVQILAGDTPIVESEASGPGGVLFQAIGGTSMSGPHIAGSGLLLKGQHPDWTPGQIKSAIMTTARRNIVKEDGTTPADPFDFGAGHVDLTKAGNPGLTFDETADRFAALTGDPIHAVDLNIPSVNATVMPGSLTTHRLATNVTSRSVKYNVTTSASPGAKITVTPSSFQLGAGKTVDLTIKLEGATLPEGTQAFGVINLVPGNANTPTRLHLPVAFVKTQGSVGLTQSCTKAQVPINGTSVCTITASNQSFGDTVVDLKTTLNTPLVIQSVSGATKQGLRTAVKTGVPLNGQVAGIPSVDPGELFGYLPLDEFGIDPIGIGDEEILNFNVPPFVYAGVTYTRVGIDSNGYIVVGGGTAEDNNCCNLTPIPNPARPNNVLAPFWTDLDGTGAQGLLVATLTDGVNTWLVVEWRVNVFGTTSERHFQTWIGVDGTEDITFAYDPAALPTDPDIDFVVGAENSNGTGGDSLGFNVLPTEDLRVASSPPTPGGSVSYTVTVKGQSAGNGVVTTAMTTSAVPGTTIALSNIKVKAPSMTGAQ